MFVASELERRCLVGCLVGMGDPMTVRNDTQTSDYWILMIIMMVRYTKQ